MLVHCTIYCVSSLNLDGKTYLNEYAAKFWMFVIIKYDLKFNKNMWIKKKTYLSILI